ncbi:MAG TPA: hypothetical protein VGJ05_09165 [Fimbriiglobus sp.]|jgi:hypothetical protein
MSIDPALVRSIKRNLAEKTSDELRQLLVVRNRAEFSDEAFVAAEELINDREKGVGKEPPPKLPPPPPPTRAESEAAEEALLRRQVRVIGAYYYFLAGSWILIGIALTRIGGDLGISAINGVFGLGFGLLGWSLRRFHPAARTVGMIVSILQVPAFPLGTVIGLYCFSKLTRADRLFGGIPHPEEYGNRHNEPDPDAIVAHRDR